MIPKNQQLKFIQWATFWHGDHDDCEVAKTLIKYQDNQITFEEVFNAVIETEGTDWQESWEQFISN